MKEQRRECINPTIGKQIYIEIFDAGINRRLATLSREHEAHIRACPYCGPLVPAWKIKAGGRLADAERMLAAAKAGRAEVLHRREGDLDMYFKRNTPASSAGLMVKTKGGDEIISIDETSIENFEHPRVSNPSECEE